MVCCKTGEHIACCAVHIIPGQLDPAPGTQCQTIAGRVVTAVLTAFLRDAQADLGLLRAAPAVGAAAVAIVLSIRPLTRRAGPAMLAEAKAQFEDFRDWAGSVARQ